MARDPSHRLSRREARIARENEVKVKELEKSARLRERAAVENEARVAAALKARAALTEQIKASKEEAKQP